MKVKNNMLLSCSHIEKSFGDLKILKDISLKVEKNKIICIIGKSGAGKSTLLHILATLDTPDKGELYLKGRDITKLKDKEIADLRNKEIGFVFQSHCLLPEFNILENVSLPGWIGGRNKKQVWQEAKELLSFLGLQDRFNYYPTKLSGGEQQRTSVARALINNPSIVFADEPSGNLDEENTQQLYQLFLDLKKKYQTSFVIITHNPLLSSVADQVYTLKDGRIK